MGLLAACAGNPPQWWNPSGSYSQEAAAPAAGKTQPVEQPASGLEALPAVQEENIATTLPDDSYEEMILTPVQDEDTEEPATGKDSSENTMDITPSVPDTSTSLPVPSVLTE